MDVWMYGCMDVWMYGCMNVWMYGCMDVWMYGCMDGCMDMLRASSYKYGCMDGCVPPYMSIGTAHKGVREGVTLLHTDGISLSYP